MKKIYEKNLKHEMPKIIMEIMDVLESLHPNADYNCRLNIVLAKIAQMISFHRVCFQELENIKLVNHYAINFMPSGMGKDKISNDLDTFIFNIYYTYFKDRTINYKLKLEEQLEREAEAKFCDEKNQMKKETYIQAEKAKIRNLNIEINNATPEGFFADAKAFEKAGFGSVFVKLSEFGLFLQNPRPEEMAFFKTLFEAYDGKVSSKATKHEQRESSIDNMPVSILLHSDFGLFKTDIEKSFELLMQIGLARRAFISFQSNNTKLIERDPKKARKRQEVAYAKASIISKDLFCLFSKIQDGAIYKLTDEAYDNMFYPYYIKISELGNEHQNEALICKEIASRELKVLKIAGMFACLNHPDELFIYETDVEQAICTVEILSQDFKRFIDYKPMVNDNYELLFDFLLKNINEKFHKTELVGKYRDFGFKRETFRRDFDGIIEVVSEMADEKGYYLQKELVNNNSGISISLVKSNLGEAIPTEVKNLTDLI